MASRQTTQFAELYFRLGFSQKDILSCLAWNHGVIISRRTLQRWLKKRNLYRRKKKSDLLEIGGTGEFGAIPPVAVDAFEMLS